MLLLLLFWLGSHCVLTHCSRKPKLCNLCNLQEGKERYVMISHLFRNMMSLKRMILLPQTPPFCSCTSSSLSLFPFFSSLLYFLVWLHSVNRYLLNTCQVSGPVGNRNKTRKKTDESLLLRSWHSSGGLWSSLISTMRGKTGCSGAPGRTHAQISGVRGRRPLNWDWSISKD